MENNSKAMMWGGRVLSGLAAAVFLFSCSGKLMGSSQMVQGFDHLGWPQAMLTTIGALELLCVVLYLVPQIAVLGGIILTGYLGGAIATHIRIGEPVYLHVVIGLFIWGGLYLREPRLRKLVPVLSKS